MTWMISVVRSRALDWLRRPRLEDKEADYDALLEALPDQGDPERLLDQSRDSRALDECLAQLPASSSSASCSLMCMECPTANWLSI